MAYELIDAEDGVITIRLSGLMRFTDQLGLQGHARALIAEGRQVRVLAYAGDFQGWERTDDWSDVGFLVEHGDDIVRMAIVGDERWREDVLLFVGKGFRRTAIEFFPTGREAEAEHWVRE